MANFLIGNIQAIYRYNEMPSDFSEELDLVRLYTMILDTERRSHEYTSLHLYKN